MIWRRIFAWDANVPKSARRRRAALGRDVLARGRRRRPGVEALEGRALLATLTDFPLSSNQSASATAA